MLAWFLWLWAALEHQLRAARVKWAADLISGFDARQPPKRARARALRAAAAALATIIKADTSAQHDMRAGAVNALVNAPGCVTRRGRIY